MVSFKCRSDGISYIIWIIMVIVWIMDLNFHHLSELVIPVYIFYLSELVIPVCIFYLHLYIIKTFAVSNKV
jgi:hypothetical protein